MSSIITKIKILIKATNVFKNWYLYPLVYFSIIKRDYIIFETYSGLKIKLRTRSTDLMALTNVWLVEEYSGSNFRINANDVIIDIGAHVGLFTLYASQYCKNGTIFCFEPVDENYDILVDNITQNNLKNVKPFKSAVSKSESTITIYRNKDEAGHSMFSFTSHALKVDSISLKKIIDENSVNQCNLIKIDCEGAEYEIIESLPLEYFKKISKLIIEYHFADSKPKLVNDLKTKLMTASFKISTVSHSSDMGLLYAIK
mgnify:FL=1